MVGALADWFAVTALFRHPLGLPIPHTAIIPRKKDQLGVCLRRLRRRELPLPDVVRERLRAVGIARRLGGWLASRSNADRVTGELSAAVRGAVTVLRDADVQAVVGEAITRRADAQQGGRRSAGCWRGCSSTAHKPRRRPDLRPRPRLGREQPGR